MDGKGHMLVAPVFSVGASWLFMNMGLLEYHPDKVMSIGIIGGLSLLSCKWADADLLALKPTKIITGRAKKRYSKKYKKDLYYVKVSRKDFETKYKSRAKAHNSTQGSKETDSKESGKYEFTNSGSVYVYYESCKRAHILQLGFAMLFKVLGLKQHRGWQSHSPILWVPIWLALICLFSQVDIYGHYLGLVITGLAFGYWSHIFGDLCTKDGAPLFPPSVSKRLSKIPIIGFLFQEKLSPVGGSIRIGKYRFRINSAKASNMKWTYFVVFCMVVVFTYLLVPDLFWWVVDKIGELLKFIWECLADLYDILFVVMKGSK